MDYRRWAGIVLVTAAGIMGPAYAGQSAAPDAAVLATVDATLSAAQSGDVKTLREEYLPGSTFVDEFAPFIWTGPGSLDAYFASAGAMYQETKMSDTTVSRSKPSYVYVAGKSAYVIVPLRIKAKVGGKPYAATGSLAFTLQKTDSGWKIASQTWAKATENISPY
jgi:ketosteroid isomerase-like protein